jgi:hypothetical protein
MPSSVRNLILNSFLVVFACIITIPELITVRITLAELQASERPTVDFVEILSLEGQRYAARLGIGDTLRMLSDEAGDTLLFRSSHEARQVLGELEVDTFELVHPSAYDEMIGLPGEKAASMRIPITGEKT